MLPVRAATRARLDPIRFALPRWRTLLRGATVLALLATAVLVLYAGPPVAPVRPDSTPPDPVVTPSATGSALPAGLVGVPVRLSDPGAAAALRAGDRVDLIAMADPPSVVAPGALVLAVPDVDAAVVLLAMVRPQAMALVRYPAEVRFAVIVRS